MRLFGEDKGGVVMKLLKDTTLLGLGEIFSKALGRDSINKIAVRTGLFSMVDVEDEFPRYSSKELLARYILESFSWANVLSERKKREELLLLINSFYKELPFNSQKKVEEVMLDDEYVPVDGVFTYTDYVLENEDIFTVPNLIQDHPEKAPKHIYIKGIGNGFFSNVSIYLDEKTGRKFARKKLLKEHWDNEDYIERFKREIVFLKQLQGQPHVVNLFDYDLDTKELRYDMELANDNLYDHIKKNNGDMQITERTIIFEQIFHAICEAHSRSIIHRDLSPKNILTWNTTPFTLVKVADFGLGRSNKELKQHTKSNISDFGHVLYVAPEQREKLKAATHQSDIYSLGRLFAFILTGRDPDNVNSNIDFYSIIKKATRLEPSERYDNVEQMRDTYFKMKEELLHQYDEEEQRKRALRKTP
jgi:tRNA A-37 threonylcarbamoyl transferase component Bud32